MFARESSSTGCAHSFSLGAAAFHGMSSESLGSLVVLIVAVFIAVLALVVTIGRPSPRQQFVLELCDRLAVRLSPGDHSDSAPAAPQHPVGIERRAS